MRFRRFFEFIKYHNAFSIGFALVFLGFGSAMAVSPGLREGVTDVIISTKQTVKTIDNSYIVNINLNTYTPSIQITNITEDETYYYVSYILTTIDLADDRWQNVSKGKVLKISKAALGERDLGLYATEELSEIVDWQLSYLREVQEIEGRKGISQKVVATVYSGLIGKFLDPKEEVFTGYEPVIKPKPKPVVIAVEPIDTQSLSSSLQTSSENADSNTSPVIVVEDQSTDQTASSSLSSTETSTSTTLEAIGDEATSTTESILEEVAPQGAATSIGSTTPSQISSDEATSTIPALIATTTPVSLATTTSSEITSETATTSEVEVVQPESNGEDLTSTTTPES